VLRCSISRATKDLKAADALEPGAVGVNILGIDAIVAVRVV